jgi:hypothetical protein
MKKRHGAGLAVLLLIGGIVQTRDILETVKLPAAAQKVALDKDGRYDVGYNWAYDVGYDWGATEKAPDLNSYDIYDYSGKKPDGYDYTNSGVELGKGP